MLSPRIARRCRLYRQATPVLCDRLCPTLACILGSRVYEGEDAERYRAGWRCSPVNRWSENLRAGGVICALHMYRVSVHWPMELLYRESTAPKTGALFGNVHK